MADGKVVIDTQLDLTGIEQGARSLELLLKNGPLNASLNTLKSKVNEITKATQSLDSSVKQTSSAVSRGMKDIRNVLKGGGVAVALHVTKQAIDDIAESTKRLQDSIRMSSTLFGDVAVDTQHLAKEFTALATQTGFVSEELGTGLYNALSAGIPVTEDMGEATAFLEKSAKTAKGGFADLGQTVTATAAVLNAYKLGVKETDRVQGILLQTQNLGITTVGQLAASLAQVVPTAASFSVSFEQVGAALATITAQGTPTAQATTALNGLLAELGKQSQQAAKNLKAAAESAGLQSTTFADLTADGYTLNDVLQLMADYAEKDGLTLVDMFGSVEAGRAALQLASGDGEKFNSALAKMGDTAGLVDDAFNKVYSATDRFNASVEEAKKTIGLKFAPAVNDMKGSLADMLNGLTGNKDTAGDLSRALTSLKDATEAYRQAQENAKDSTDETTLSMLEQSAVAYQSALLELERQYQDAVKELPSIADDIDDNNRKLQDAERVLNKMAEDYGKTRAELAQYYAEGGLDTTDYDKLVYEQRTEEVVKYTNKIKDLQLEQDKATATVDQFIAQSAKAYKDGALDLDYYKETNFELYNAIKQTADGMSAGEKEAERLLSRYGDNAEELQKLIRTQTALADLFKDNAEKQAYHLSVVEALTKAYDKLTQSEIKATASGSAGGSSDGTASGAPEKKSAAELKNEAESFDKIWTELTKDITDTEKISQALGKEFDSSAHKITLLEDAIKDLIVAGMDPADARIKYLQDSIAALKNETAEAKDGFAELTAELEKTFSKDMLVDTMNKSFSALADTIANAGEKIEQLKDQNEDAQEDLADAEEERLEALSEYNDALARGNESDAEAAQKKLKSIDKTIKGYKDLISANEDEQKELESGEEAWKAFGRAALASIGEVLLGLGARLAAEAVLKAISMDFAGAGIATAGSVAAIAAGIGLKTAANSFAEGGIVQQEAGKSKTGDQHVAFVNPGELILNESQQSNLADKIRANSMFDSALRTGGDSIIINLSGAYIYGLDEPAVGRAIYDNIARLRSEGTL